LREFGEEGDLEKPPDHPAFGGGDLKDIFTKVCNLEGT